MTPHIHLKYSSYWFVISARYIFSISPLMLSIIWLFLQSLLTSPNCFRICGFRISIGFWFKSTSYKPATQFLLSKTAHFIIANQRSIYGRSKSHCQFERWYHCLRDWRYTISRTRSNCCWQNLLWMKFEIHLIFTSRRSRMTSSHMASYVRNITLRMRENRFHRYQLKLMQHNRLIFFQR